MHPILFSIAGVSVFSLSVFLVIAWLVFSFVFWKLLRNVGVGEQRVFDLTFYSTIVSLISARVVFVLVNPVLFSDNFLKVAAFWVQPGLSLYGGLVGAMGTIVYLSRRYKVRLAFVLDAWAVAFPMALIVGEIGSLLDGTEVGKLFVSPWSILYIGHVGKRHPVQLYEIMVLVLLLVVMFIFQKKAEIGKWPFGLVGVWFFLLFSIFMFIIEFVKETGANFLRLNINQWILIAIFAESLGALYVRGGGREKFRPMIRRVIGAIYTKFSKRHA